MAQPKKHPRLDEALAAELADELEEAMIPSPPHPESHGDMTLAYISWYHRYHTREEFEEKYRGRLSDVIAGELGIKPIK